MPQRKTALDLWLTGEKVPTPLVDLLLERPVILERPYREIFLASLRKELRTRRTPEMLVSNILNAVAGNYMPPITRNIVPTMTKETIRRRYGLTNNNNGSRGENKK